MSRQSQISATISEATKEKLDRFTESHGLKKNFVVEQALLYFMEARRELPDEALVPAATGLLLAVGLIQSGCFLFGSGDRALWENAGTIYFHEGISPGPNLLTRADGTVLEERRYEPLARRSAPSASPGTRGPSSESPPAKDHGNQQLTVSESYRLQCFPGQGMVWL